MPEIRLTSKADLRALDDSAELSLRNGELRTKEGWFGGRMMRQIKIDRGDDRTAKQAGYAAAKAAIIGSVSALYDERILEGAYKALSTEDRERIFDDNYPLTGRVIKQLIDKAEELHGREIERQPDALDLKSLRYFADNPDLELRLSEEGGEQKILERKATPGVSIARNAKILLEDRAGKRESYMGAKQAVLQTLQRLYGKELGLEAFKAGVGRVKSDLVGRPYWSTSGDHPLTGQHIARMLEEASRLRGGHVAQWFDRATGDGLLHRVGLGEPLWPVGGELDDYASLQFYVEQSMREANSGGFGLCMLELDMHGGEKRQIGLGFEGSRRDVLLVFDPDRREIKPYRLEAWLKDKYPRSRVESAILYNAKTTPLGLAPGVNPSRLVTRREKAEAERNQAPEAEPTDTFLGDNDIPAGEPRVVGHGEFYEGPVDFVNDDQTVRILVQRTLSGPDPIRDTEFEDHFGIKVTDDLVTVPHDAANAAFGYMRAIFWDRWVRFDPPEPIVDISEDEE